MKEDSKQKEISNQERKRRRDQHLKEYLEREKEIKQLNQQAKEKYQTFLESDLVKEVWQEYKKELKSMFLSMATGDKYLGKGRSEIDEYEMKT